jgi:hypothetical protein
VTKVDKEDKEIIYCEFLDKLNPGWYDIKEEKSEIRRCIPSEEHKRTHRGQVQTIEDCAPVSIQSAVQKPKESGEVRNKSKERRINKREADGGRKKRKK